MNQITKPENNSGVSENSVYYVKNEPVMQCAIDVLPRFENNNKLILKAKGNAIPNAVAIANIITDKFLKGNSHIENVTVDSEILKDVGKMISLIEVIIKKDN